MERERVEGPPGTGCRSQVQHRTGCRGRGPPTSRIWGGESYREGDTIEMWLRIEVAISSGEDVEICDLKLLPNT